MTRRINSTFPIQRSIEGMLPANSHLRLVVIITLVNLIGCSGSKDDPYRSGSHRNNSSEVQIDGPLNLIDGAIKGIKSAAPPQNRPIPEIPPRNPPRKKVSDRNLVKGETQKSSPFLANIEEPETPAISKVPVETKPKSQKTSIQPFLPRAPEIELELLNGGRFSLREHRARNIVIIDFWATWCVPCVRELPELAEVAAEFRDKNVVFFPINVGEDSATIQRFLSDRNLNLKVPRDSAEYVADAYGAKSIPMLVLIDRKGRIQKIHEGYRADLKTILRGELKTLIAGENLSGGSLPNHQLADYSNPLPGQFHKSDSFKLDLSSGRGLDIGSLFRQEGEAYKERIEGLAKADRLINYKYANGEPRILISRRSSVLHGPTAAFHANGAPMVCLNYDAGRRDQTLFSWNETKRPLIFEQYESGKLHGIRCLFKGCCEKCDEGHIWLVEEWDQGNLVQSHLVPDDEVPITFVNHDMNEETSTPHVEFTIARQQIKDFHDTLDANELPLKKMVAQMGKREKQILEARKQRARSQFLAAIASSRQQKIESAQRLAMLRPSFPRFLQAGFVGSSFPQIRAPSTGSSVRTRCRSGGG